jgi:hypothetical protein
VRKVFPRRQESINYIFTNRLFRNGKKATGGAECEKDEGRREIFLKTARILLIADFFKGEGHKLPNNFEDRTRHTHRAEKRESEKAKVLF